MVTVEEVRKAQRAEGPATVMAIGTAIPPNCVEQSTYPDYYFRITNSEHKTELKEKFKRMCKGSAPSIHPILFLLFSYIIQFLFVVRYICKKKKKKKKKEGKLSFPHELPRNF
jgi:hypothetical protein